MPIVYDRPSWGNPRDDEFDVRTCLIADIGNGLRRRDREATRRHLLALGALGVRLLLLADLVEPEGGRP